MTDEKKKNFYEDIKEIIKEMAEGLKDVVGESSQALSKKTRLSLDINPNDNINIPDSGYGSTVSSPSHEEKGIRDSYESEKQKNVNDHSLDRQEVLYKAKLIMVNEHEPKLNKIQVIRESLIPAQSTKNYMGPKTKERFSKLDTYYRNKQDLRTGNKSLLPPILSSGDNKQGHSR